jgi:hypothetical protein
MAGIAVTCVHVCAGKAKASLGTHSGVQTLDGADRSAHRQRHAESDVHAALLSDVARKKRRSSHIDIVILVAANQGASMQSVCS